MRQSIKISCLVGILLIVFNGCTGINYFSKHQTLKEGHIQRDNLVISDIVWLVQRYLPAAHTVLWMDTSKSHANKSYNRAFENRLREVGYAVVHTPRYKNEILLRWHIDQVSPGTIRATYQLKSATVSRLYHQNNNHYLPLGQFTIKGLGKPRYKPKKMHKKKATRKRSKRVAKKRKAKSKVKTAVDNKKKKHFQGYIRKKYNSRVWSTK